MFVPFVVRHSYKPKRGKPSSSSSESTPKRPPLQESETQNRMTRSRAASQAFQATRSARIEQLEREATLLVADIAQMRALMDVAIAADRYPEDMVLRDVKLVENEYGYGGAFSDVLPGRRGAAKVAVKTPRLHAIKIEGEELRKATYREAIMWHDMTRCRPNYIVPSFGVCEVSPGRWGMVSPWMKNGNLPVHAKSLREQGQIPDEHLRAWFGQIASGLQFLHDRDIVHGDLHGGNVLIDDNGAACLTDFGSSVFNQGTRGVYGSVHAAAVRYTSPERFDPEQFGCDSERPTPASDSYAWACVCLETLTGLPPFPNLSDSQVCIRVVRGDRPSRPILPAKRTVSDELWHLMSLCWSHTPSERPSPAEILVMLNNIESITVPVPSSSLSPRRRRSHFARALRALICA